MIRLAAARRRLRRHILARRRLLASVLAGAAVLLGLRAAADPPAPTTTILVAAHDLPAGAVVRSGDVMPAGYDPDLVPVGAATSPSAVVGKRVAAPLRRGEPVTDVRVLGSGMLAGYPGHVAMPVRVGDAEAVRLLRLGEQVDLVAASPDGASAEVVAPGAYVVGLPPDAEGSSAVTDGAVVVVAVPTPAVERLARASVSSYILPVLTR